MTITKLMLLGSLGWAAAFIIASLAFRGQPAGDWIEGILYVGFSIFLSASAARAVGCRVKPKDQA